MPPKRSVYPFIWLTPKQCSLRTNLPVSVISSAIRTGKLAARPMNPKNERIRYLVHPRDLGAFVETYYR